MSPDAGSVDSLRYPVGKFAAPAVLDPVLLRAWRQDLADLPALIRESVRGLTNPQLDTPYRAGGWTVRQTVHHVADSHLNAYARFRLALTEDAPVIKPYREELWAELADARSMPVAVSIEMLGGMHARWVVLIDNLNTEQLQKTFVHPDHGRAVPLWQTTGLYAWHSRHHIAQITALRARNAWYV